ncbi:MAG: hypothetical protein ABL899_02055 [Nitrospira sp.]
MSELLNGLGRDVYHNIVDLAKEISPFVVAFAVVAVLIGTVIYAKPLIVSIFGG